MRTRAERREVKERIRVKLRKIAAERMAWPAWVNEQNRMLGLVMRNEGKSYALLTVHRSCHCQWCIGNLTVDSLRKAEQAKYEIETWYDT